MIGLELYNEIQGSIEESTCRLLYRYLTRKFGLLLRTTIPTARTSYDELPMELLPRLSVARQPHFEFLRSGTCHPGSYQGTHGGVLIKEMDCQSDRCVAIRTFRRRGTLIDCVRSVEHISQCGKTTPQTPLHARIRCPLPPHMAILTSACL